MASGAERERMAANNRELLAARELEARRQRAQRQARATCSCSHPVRDGAWKVTTCLMCGRYLPRRRGPFLA